MAEEFDESQLFTFSPAEIEELRKAEAARAGAVSPEHQAQAAREAKWAALRKKYPLPEGARVYTSTNMDPDPVIALAKYRELVINANYFDPTADPNYRPDLAPLPTEPQRAQIFGRGENSITETNL